MQNNKKRQRKTRRSNENNIEAYSNLDYPGISYPGALFLIFSSFFCIILLPKIIKDRLVFVILSSLIVSFSFVFSNYRIGKNKRDLDKTFLIKFFVSFIIIGFVFMLAFYKI